MAEGQKIATMLMRANDAKCPICSCIESESALSIKGMMYAWWPRNTVSKLWLKKKTKPGKPKFVTPYR